MANVDELLGKLLITLERSHSPLPALLQSGLNKQQIDSEITGEDIKFPEEIYSFYLWKNGTKGTEEREWSLVELFLFNFAIFDF